MRRRLLQALAFIALAVGLAALAQAQSTRFVASVAFGGDDEGFTNDCTDAGNPCATIAHAIGQADPGDTISIGQATFSEQGLTVDKDLTINGAGVGLTEIQGDGGNRIFTIGFNVTAIIQDLRITGGGSVNEGAGIFNVGALTLNSVNVAFNTATQRGGGIFTTACCGGPGTLTLAGSSVTDNTAGQDGGGIFNDGGALVLIDDSTVWENTAAQNGGGIVTVGGTLTLAFAIPAAVIGNEAGQHGGGILADDGAAVTLLPGGVGVFGNAALTGWGGGIALHNGSTLTGSDALINGNIADTHGGAIYAGVALPVTEIELTDAIISGNTAGGNGGGIYTDGILTLTGGTVSDNTATGGGAGIGDGGGGIYNDGGFATLTEVTVSGNGTLADGGGIYTDGVLTLTGGTVSDNTATGGGVGIGDGGGIFNTDGTATLTDVTVSDNTADGDGGGIFTFTSTEGPPLGGIFETTLILTGVTVSGNTAGSGGGGILVINDTVTATNATVSGNTAGAAGGGVLVSVSDIDTTPVTFRNVTVTANNAGPAVGGGGLFVAGDQAPTLVNVLLGGNTSEGPGPDCAGLVDSDGNNLIEDTSDCVITGDTASNITGEDPLLGPLQDNGGPTFTHALLAGSFAIDAGQDLSAFFTTDQRGVSRPQGAEWDIGAFELELVSQPELTVMPAAVNFGFVAPGDSATATVTATNSGSADLTIDNISDPDEPFAITGGSCTPVPVTLAPSESCEIEVEFAPTEEGSFSASFEIESNAPSSPDTVALSGTSTVEVVPVPALNRWSLALLGGLLLLLAGSHYRRRRVCVDRL